MDVAFTLSGYSQLCKYCHLHNLVYIPSHSPVTFNFTQCGARVCRANRGCGAATQCVSGCNYEQVADGQPSALSCMWALMWSPVLARAGSTQEEVSSMLEASIQESKISGGDRPIAWDGATMGGSDLQNQVIHPPSPKP